MLLLWMTCLLPLVTGQQYLEVRGTDMYYDNEHVFLSGMNIAWEVFGYDFGNGRYDCCTGEQLEEYLDDISENGGNSIRIWIHTDGRDTPEFDSDGFVTATDREGTMISDLEKFLDHSFDNNILVIPVLWNGASDITKDEFRDLLWDESKLQSYIDNALIPMATALADKPALGAWEIINEPEGIVRIADDAEHCWDTTPLQGSGAGWVGEDVPMENILRFINWQMAAIKDVDPKALGTQGSWSERSQTDQFGYRNYYTDECLLTGGRAGGTIDFYQMHSYEWQGSYSDTSPFIVHNDEYQIDKPNVIGEFSQDGGDGRDITDQMDNCYERGYDGAWTWQANGGGHHSDDFDTQARGTQHLQGRDGEGGKVDIELQ